MANVIGRRPTTMIRYESHVSIGKSGEKVALLIRSGVSMIERTLPEVVVLSKSAFVQLDNEKT